MMLLSLLLLPLVGGFACLVSARTLIPLVLLTCNFVLLLLAWNFGELVWQVPWMAEWGIDFHLELDGLSFVLSVVTHLMGIFAIVCSQNKIDKYVGFFYCNLLWLICGVLGTVLSFDLFLFFVFWEVMLLPLYFLIYVWGGKNRIFASIQFLIFTQGSGLFLLVSILGLVLAAHDQTGIYTFDYHLLSKVSLSEPVELLIVCGLLIAFLVKLPAFPFHIWLPPLFVESPLAPVLTGIMVKTGAYGILRFVVGMLPLGSSQIAPVMMTLGLFGIIYGAVMAFSQTDIRKVLAFATISHMGLVLVALFSESDFARDGVVVLLVTEALSTGGLLALFNHIGRFDLDSMGGLFQLVPKIGVVALFFIMASVGLPLFGNFVGEWMTLSGIFSSSKIVAAIATSGLILSAIYYLRLMQRMFFGVQIGNQSIFELSSSQVCIYGALVCMLVLIGIYPAPLLMVIGRSL